MHAQDAEITVNRLTPADARIAAAVHARAFPAHFLTSLGPAFLAEYYRSVARDASSVALAARESGTLVGLCVGSPDPRGFYRRLLRRRWWTFAPLAALAALRRPSRTARLLRATGHSSAQVDDAAAAGLFSLAVSPAQQGRGIGATLVARFVEESAARGCFAVVLETDNDDNDAVNGFYERLGFRMTSTYATPEGRVMRRYRYDLAHDSTHGEL